MPTLRAAGDVTNAAGDLRSAWLAVAEAPVVTASMAEDALSAMELLHTRYLEEQEPIARRLLAVTAEMDRADLTLRTELILASIALRNGSPIEASARLAELSGQVETLGDAYLLARVHYLRAWISYFTGDEPSTRIHAARSVELLPDDAPTGVRSDHIATIAIGFGKDPEGQHYYDEALSLAQQSADRMRAVTLHNNIAYSALLRGDLDRARVHVEAMLAESERSGVPIKAVHLETVARFHLLSGDYAAALATLAPVRDAVIGAADPADSTYFSEPHSMPAALLTLAETHRELGDLDEAQEMLDQATIVMERRGVSLIEPDLLQEQAKIFAARRDFEAAYRAFVAFHEAKEAQQSEEQQARARIVQASFDSDRTRKDAERYRELAMRDALTGLYNRRYMNELLAEEIPRADEEGSPLSLAIVDADFFKRVNDEFSHKTGDHVLQTVAGLMAEARPAGATVCRLGGEEFVIIMPGFETGKAFEACEAVRHAIADHDWNSIGDGLRVTVSIGVTTAVAGRTSIAALLADADRNLYAAKRSGRNRVMADAQ